MLLLLVGILVDQPAPANGVHFAPELTVGVSAGMALRAPEAMDGDVVGQSFGAHVGVLLGAGFGLDAAWSFAEWGYSGMLARGADDSSHIIGAGIRYEGMPDWRVRPVLAFHGGVATGLHRADVLGAFFDLGVSIRLAAQIHLGLTLTGNFVGDGEPRADAYAYRGTSRWFGLNLDLGSVLRL
jgi:hypothetical protein